METNGQAPAAPQALDTDGAADVLLERFKTKMDQPEAKEETPEPKEENAEESAEPVEEAPEGQADDTEEAAVEEESEEELEWDGQKYKVKGKTPTEIRDALLRQADYTRKTMELSEQRKAFEAARQANDVQLKLREATLEKRAELYSLQQEYQRMLAQDWDQLTNDNPVEALKQQAKMKRLEARGAQIQAEVQGAEQQIMALQRQQSDELLRKGHEALTREIPGWNRDIATRLRDYGKALGYTENEMNDVYDPRFVKALHKARLYDELIAKKPQVTKRVAEAPKGLKPGPGNQQSQGNKVRRDEADSRLRKSGRLDDAANAILARIVKGRK